MVFYWLSAVVQDVQRPFLFHYETVDMMGGRMNTSQFIYQAFSPPVEQPQLCDALCALTGQPITQGFSVGQIVSSAMGDVADIVRFHTGWISVPAAACMKASKLLRGNLLALPERGIRPFVSASSATEERPCWRDLLMELESVPTVAIFSDEAKRRLWPYATLSTFGERWRPFFNAAPHREAATQSRTLSVCVSLLRECLALVEQCYSYGFPKSAIANGLLDVNSRKAIDKVGMAETAVLNRQLAAWRGRDEFVLSLFVAQVRPNITIPEKEQKPCLEISFNRPLQPTLF